VAVFLVDSVCLPMDSKVEYWPGPGAAPDFGDGERGAFEKATVASVRRLDSVCGPRESGGRNDGPGVEDASFAKGLSTSARPMRNDNAAAVLFDDKT
jgi:hypothetical protein